MSGVVGCCCGGKSKAGIWWVVGWESRALYVLASGRLLMCAGAYVDEGEVDFGSRSRVRDMWASLW